ncbi:MAG: amino acid adenylation domain-containing protein, partial [Stigonema ocellatum SAG 48.90 = DSM 106950]|nr:amino acid adenylation domain-containing protein [Stigonema ocellatum SAG 48.90 = DSM 106950]
MNANVMTLLEVLQHRAAATPQQVCYTHAEQLSGAVDLTCGELHDAARSMAAALRAQAAPGDRVLILLPTGLDFVVAFYACLYAGLVAVPLYPPKANDGSGKIPNIVADCLPRLALVAEDLPAERLDALANDAPAQSPLRVMRMGDLAGTGAAPDPHASQPGPDTLAFLQYSSGSTGDPKGVMIAHRNITANMAVIREEIASDARDVFVGWLPFFHDMGMVMNLLLPMFNGSRSVFFSPLKFAKSPLYWLQVLSHYRGTVSGGPNFAFESCLRKAAPQALQGLDLAAWRVAPNGAEPVRADTIERFAECFAGAGFRREAVMPSYGMAEAVVFVCSNRHDHFPAIRAVAPEAALGDVLPALAEAQAAPAATEAARRTLRVVGNGAPPAAHTMRIVHDGRSLPERHVGEVWVRGDSIAAGYWGHPALSEATFRAFTADGEGPFLRTGDIGFYDGGELFLLGRLKEMLIVQGRNLYPQDLELCARRVLPEPATGDGALFAADMPGGEASEAIVLVQEVRPRLCQKPLAAYAVDVRAAVFGANGVLLQQVVFVPMGAVLKTTSGKVMRSQMRERWQRGELAALHVDILDAAADAADPIDEAPRPATATEQQLARLWADVLGLSGAQADVPAQASFLQWGGDSLAMARLQEAIRAQWQVVLSTRDAFEHATLAGMAAWIDVARASGTAQAGVDQPAMLPVNGGGVAVPLDAGEQAGSAPLSFAQQRLWFLAQLHDGSGESENIGLALHLQGVVDLAALDASMTALVARHEALRARFFTDAAGEPRQVTLPPVPCTVSHLDLRGLPPERQARALKAALDEAVASRFPLDGGVMLRGQLVRLDARSQVLIWTLHHIAADGWSMGVLVREWAAFYNAACQQRSPALAPLPLQYADFARWQRQPRPAQGAQDAERYWLAALQGLPTVHGLPLDRPRGLRPGYVGGVVKSRIDAHLTQRFKRLCAEQRATLFMGLHALLAALVARLSGESDIVIGSPMANREPAVLQGLIGVFVNTVVLRSRLAADITLSELLDQSRRTATAALEHQAYPFDRLVEQLAPARRKDVPPLFQLMLVLQNSAFELPALDGLVAQSAEEIDTFARVDLTLGVHESADGLSLTWTFNRQLLDAARVERMAAAWAQLLAAGVARPQAPIGTLALLDAAQRRAAVQALCGEVQPVPAHSLAALLQAGSARAPDALAVVGEDEQLTHAELQRRAGQLAHWLRAQGLQPDERVGLCLERGAAMIVALLGIVQAGGAYVALDAAYPVQRLAGMCEDAGMRLLLGHGPTHATVQALARPGLSLVDLDDPALRQALQAQPSQPPAPAAGFGEHSLAYVIYTSGSTGQPKGVMVEHRQLLSHLHHHVRQCGLQAGDRVLQFASLSFDASVEEIFPTLSVGATLVVRPRRLVAPDAAFTAFLATHRITVADLPTAFWHQWAEEIAAGEVGVPAEVRLVVIGGEKAETRHLRQFRRAAGGGPRVLNTYGPTEATIYATSHELPADAPLPEGDIPIGRPIANTRLYLLDEAGEPVPRGVVAEIWIGGAGVARGYLGQPALSAQRFRPDPFEAEYFGGHAGARMYRSGDLGRCDEDGTLHYLGRNDEQVKLRGYRIELGEIEARLGACEGVREAVVLVRPGPDGQPRLVAYVVVAQPQAAQPEQWLAQVQARLQAELPAYMVPAAYVPLAALPLTPNGKIDRQALPEPQAQA